jgi:acetylornithine deacetylase
MSVTFSGGGLLCKIDSLEGFGQGVGGGRPMRYSGNTMAESDPLQVVHPISPVEPPLTPVGPVRLTRALCEIESTTYQEGAVGDFLADYLASRGWAVEKTPVPQPAENAHGGERWNVFATVPGKTADVVFSTHMDTVPPYIPFTEDDEFMYGRGVSDAKGIIATQIAAAEALRAEGYPVGMLYVSGEERDSAGAREANKNPRGSRFLINGEPTENRIGLASKGALRASLKSTGKMAHSAYPELGDSAIHKLIEALTRLIALELPVDKDAGPCTLNVGQISGGHAPNVIADHAEAQVLVRVVGPSEPVRAAIREAVKGLAEVEFTLDLAFIRLKAVEGLPTMVAKFATDIPMLTNWGEPLLLGPGSIHCAHTPDEKLSKKEMLEAVELYVKVAKQLMR